jgi:hypothetical protein
MYYNPQYKMVFLGQPHTASHSTGAALLHRGFQMADPHIRFLGSRPYWRHHAKLFETKIVTPENRGDWFVFTTIRNHFDLILSRAWKFQKYNPNVDWSDMRVWEKALEPTWWVRRNALFNLHKRDADKLIRFENLKPELEEIVGPLKLPQMIKNPVRKGRHYSEFYTPEVRALVEERFGDEMKELGYEWEDQSESQRQSA